MIEVEEHGGAVIDPAQRQALREDLARWRVETVIVGPMAHQPDMVAFFADLLQRVPVERGGAAQIQWNVLGSRDMDGHPPGRAVSRRKVFYKIDQRAGVKDSLAPF